MNFTDLIPNVTIDNKYVFQNIFFKPNLNTDLDDKYLQIYKISDGELIEHISYNVYGDTRYTWVIMVVNNFTDPIFDLALPDDAIMRRAQDEATIGGTIDYEKYSILYDKLSEENDNKRNIKVIKNEYLGSFITEVIRVVESE